MACIDFPLPTLPTLPDPLTLGLALSLDLSSDIDFCCKIVSFPPFAVSLPLPPLVLNLAFITALNGFIASMNEYHDALPFDCPFE